MSGPAPIAASSLGLTPPSHAPALEGQELSRSAVFERIDEVAARLDGAGGEARADLLVRLGQLYISTGLLKHRPEAIECLDRAVELNPRLSQALHVHATMLEGMGRPHEAREVHELVIERFPDDPESFYALGRFLFDQARVTLDHDGFAEALAAFERCLLLDDRAVDAWRGVAAGALATNDMGRSLEAAERLIALGAVHEGWFLAGAAHAAMQHEKAAALAFDRALEGSDATLRQVFAARGVLERDTANQLTAIDLADPDRFPMQLTYWRRLVESDVLFGDATSNKPGWDTVTGDLWVRWGRPLDIAFEAPDFEGLEAADRGSFVDRVERDFMPSPEPNRKDRSKTGVLDMDDVSQKLHWLYRVHGKDARFTFQDVTFHYHWTPTNEAGRQIQELKSEVPFAADTRLPTVDFELVVAAAGFYGPDGVPELESYVAVEPIGEIGDLEPGDSLATIEWKAYRPDGSLVDAVDLPLRVDRDLGSLQRALGEEPSQHSSSLLMALGAKLDPGDYRIEIKATSTRNGSWRSAQLNVQLRSLPDHLVMSDLQLASTYTPYEPSMQVPTEFLKYGYGVVPNPSRTFAGESLYVYFEMYNVAVAADGKTQFDVTYEVFRAGDASDRVEPLTTSFVQERTGTSAAGLVVKGSSVDISQLPRGAYRLAVTVVDRVAMQKTTRTIEFHVPGAGSGLTEADAVPDREVVR